MSIGEKVGWARSIDREERTVLAWARRLTKGRKRWDRTAAHAD